MKELLISALLFFYAFAHAEVKRSDFESYPGLTQEALSQEGATKILKGVFPNSKLPQFRVEITEDEKTKEKRLSEAQFKKEGNFVVANIETSLKNSSGQTVSSTRCEQDSMSSKDPKTLGQMRLSCVTINLDYCDAVDMSLKSSQLLSPAAAEVAAACSAYTASLDSFWRGLDETLLKNKDYRATSKANIDAARSIANKIDPGLGGNVASMEIRMTDHDLKMAPPTSLMLFNATTKIAEVRFLCEAFRKLAPPRSEPNSPSPNPPPLKKRQGQSGTSI